MLYSPCIDKTRKIKRTKKCLVYKRKRGKEEHIIILYETHTFLA